MKPVGAMRRSPIGPREIREHHPYGAASHAGWTLPDRSGEPAFAAFVVLGVAERLPLAFGDTEIEFLHVLVLAQRLGGTVHHDAAVLEDVAVTGVLERHVGVLLGEQEGYGLLLVETVHDLENLLDD